MTLPSLYISIMVLLMLNTETLDTAKKCHIDVTLLSSSKISMFAKHRHAPSQRQIDNLGLFERYLALDRRSKADDDDGGHDAITQTTGSASLVSHGGCIGRCLVEFVQ